MCIYIYVFYVHVYTYIYDVKREIERERRTCTGAANVAGNQPSSASSFGSRI